MLCALCVPLWVAFMPGCEEPSQDVLSTPPPDTVRVYATCENVFADGRKGDACKLETDCMQKSECLVETARCVNGLLFFAYEELPCPECLDDTNCGPKALCIDGVCNACPDTPTCPGCPEGWVPLSRNDCATCECGPPTQCVDNAACGAGGLECAIGQVCAEGCQRLDCCANVCSEPGCKGGAPVGCAMKCEDPACGGNCRAEACKCDPTSGTWVCAASCAKVTAMCVVP